MANEQKKRCSGCNELKPTSEYFKDKSTKDGLKKWCKHCHKVAAATGVSPAIRLQAHEPEGLKAQEGLNLDIHTWSQADSVLRELCEVELSLRAVTANRNRSILKTKSESDRTVHILKTQQRGLFVTLERFALGEQRYIGMGLKMLRFGVVRVYGGECEVELNLTHAFKSKDKP